MKGWIKSTRKSKGLTFCTITDGKRDHQITMVDGECVIDGELKVGASFVAEGVYSKTPKGQDEFLVSKLTIVGVSDDTYPIQPKKHSDEFLRSIPELRGRTKGMQATWKMRHYLTQAIHKFMDAEGFIQYYTPLITHADCEGAGETFDVQSDWMHEKLTVSGQLHGEVGMMSLGKIYTFSPCFRAEKSMTRKHLSEFWMIEPEMAFYDLEQTIEFASIFVKEVMLSVISRSVYPYDEFKQLGISSETVADMASMIKQAWPVVTYQEVIEKFGVIYGDDISSEVEKKVVDYFKLSVFITHYPKELKPFYMKKDDKVAYCFDLIFPEVGEVIGGSQREESYDVLCAQMTEAGLDMEKMKWYLSTRKYGTVPHSGFGLGFERLLMYLTKASKIHDVIPFPVSY